MGKWIEAVRLGGTHVELEPLDLAHTQALITAASDGELWNLWYTTVPAPDRMETYVKKALGAGVEKGELAFAVRDIRSDAVVGSTRYCNVDEKNQRLEIGYTWYAKRVQRTAVNTECKYLLLRHAFENLGAIAVEFRTHWHNRASRAAITRIGAKQDGVLRQHQRGPDGVYRDTVVYSIIDSEWPAVRRTLLSALA